MNSVDLSLNIFSVNSSLLFLLLGLCVLRALAWNILQKRRGNQDAWSMHGFQRARFTHNNWIDRTTRKNAGCRGRCPPTPGVSACFGSSSVTWNRCAAKSVALIASNLPRIWQARSRIASSVSVRTVRRFVSVLRRPSL